jgi:hypothetical protein
MTPFVEECRREWQRLGVPDLLAEEMAMDLEADLAEAEAEGVSAAEILGESDPRRFAETWASARGLVPEQPPPRKSRKRLWIWVAVGLAILAFFVLLPALALVGGGGSASVGHLSGFPVTPLRRTRIPNLVGLKVCRAELIAVQSGLNVHIGGRERSRRCDLIVSGQTPTPGNLVRLDARHAVVTLRLGRARR